MNGMSLKPTTLMSSGQDSPRAAKRVVATPARPGRGRPRPRSPRCPRPAAPRTRGRPPPRSTRRRPPPGAGPRAVPRRAVPAGSRGGGPGRWRGPAGRTRGRCGCGRARRGGQPPRRCPTALSAVTDGICPAPRRRLARTSGTPPLVQSLQVRVLPAARSPRSGPRPGERAGTGSGRARATGHYRCWRRGGCSPPGPGRPPRPGPWVAPVGSSGPGSPGPTESDRAVLRLRA